MVLVLLSDIYLCVVCAAFNEEQYFRPNCIFILISRNWSFHLHHFFISLKLTIVIAALCLGIVSPILTHSPSSVSNSRTAGLVLPVLAIKPPALWRIWIRIDLVISYRKGEFCYLLLSAHSVSFSMEVSQEQISKFHLHRPQLYHNPFHQLPYNAER